MTNAKKLAALSALSNLPPQAQSFIQVSHFDGPVGVARSVLGFVRRTIAEGKVGEIPWTVRRTDPPMEPGARPWWDWFVGRDEKPDGEPEQHAEGVCWDGVETAIACARAVAMHYAEAERLDEIGDRIWIHAGQKWDGLLAELAREHGYDLAVPMARGAIIGSVRVVGFVREEKP